MPLVGTMITAVKSQEFKCVRPRIGDAFTDLGRAFGLGGSQASSASGFIDENGNYYPRTCFTKGTKIHKLKDSVVAKAANLDLLEVNSESEELVNIEDVKTGNFVRSWNEKTGKMGYKKVLNTFERVSEGIYNLELSNGETIQPTWNHPFWVLSGEDNSSFAVSLVSAASKSGKWVETKDLKPGDRLLAANGDIITVEDISYDAGKVTVYNFEVEDNHTYFVGDSGVLVHNDSCSLNPLTDVGKLITNLARERGISPEAMEQILLKNNKVGSYDELAQMVRDKKPIEIDSGKGTHKNGLTKEFQDKYYPEVVSTKKLASYEKLDGKNIFDFANEELKHQKEASEKAVKDAKKKYDDAVKAGKSTALIDGLKKILTERETNNKNIKSLTQGHIIDQIAAVNGMRTQDLYTKLGQGYYNGGTDVYAVLTKYYDKQLDHHDDVGFAKKFGDGSRGLTHAEAQLAKLTYGKDFPTDDIKIKPNTSLLTGNPLGNFGNWFGNLKIPFTNFRPFKYIANANNSITDDYNISMATNGLNWNGSIKPAYRETLIHELGHTNDFLDGNGYRLKASMGYANNFFNPIKWLSNFVNQSNPLGNFMSNNLTKKDYPYDFEVQMKDLDYTPLGPNRYRDMEPDGKAELPANMFARIRNAPVDGTGKGGINGLQGEHQYYNYLRQFRKDWVYPQPKKEGQPVRSR